MDLTSPAFIVPAAIAATIALLLLAAELLIWRPEARAHAAYQPRHERIARPDEIPHGYVRWDHCLTCYRTWEIVSADLDANMLEIRADQRMIQANATAQLLARAYTPWA